MSQRKYDILLPIDEPTKELIHDIQKLVQSNQITLQIESIWESEIVKYALKTLKESLE